MISEYFNRDCVLKHSHKQKLRLSFNCSVRADESKTKMLGELVLTVGVILITYALYKFATNSAQYFKDRNLKYRGAATAINALYKVIFGKMDAFNMIQVLYDAFPEES